MASIDRSSVNRLIGEARTLDHGPTQVELFREAVRIADLLNDVDLAYRTRSELVSAAVLSGAPEVAMVAFSWNLARFDAEPSRFSESDLLRNYGSVLKYLPGFPEVAREQIETALGDYERRFRASGIGMRPVHETRFIVSDYLGDLEEFRASRDRWLESPRTRFCASSGYERYILILSHVRDDRDEEALRLAEPFLAESSPASRLAVNTATPLLLPLVKAGRVDEAMALHRRHGREAAKDPGLLGVAADHIRFLALTDNLDRAVKIFEQSLARTLGSFSMSARAFYSEIARFLFHRLGARGKRTIRLRLPESFPLHRASGRYATAELADWFWADAEALGARFDARNGNDRYANDRRKTLDWDRWVAPFPLRKSPAGKAAAGGPAAGEGDRG